MRRFVALALLSVTVSASAMAAPKGGKGKGKKGKADEKSGTSMDVGGDPTVKERSDPGPYAPKGKTGSLAKEEEEKKEQAKVEEAVAARPRDSRLFFGDVVVGFGRAPIPGPANSTGDDRTNKASPVIALKLGGSYDLSPALTLGLRIPWSTASTSAPGNGVTESAMAFGAPELSLEYRKDLSLTTTVPILFGVGIPIAQGDPDPNSGNFTDYNVARTNLLADAATGWRDGELYWPKRVPVVLGVGITHDRRDWELHASTKLVAGINFGKALINPVLGGNVGRRKLNTVALRNVTLVGASYELLSKPSLYAALDGWLVYNAIEPIEFVSTATKKTAFQMVVEPRLGARFGKLMPALGVIIPISGRMGDTGIVGLHAHADYAW